MILLWLATVFANNPMGGSVRLNGASAEELASIDGVSLALARQVVALRTQRGRLRSVEELRILPSFPEAALDALRSGTTVEIEFGPSSGTTFTTPEAVLGSFANEPSVQDVQTWAAAHAQSSPDQVRRWLRSSKNFAALPTLWVRYRFTQDWDQDYRYFASDGVIDQQGEPLFNVLDDAGTAQEAQYMVQARWNLDKLVMSSERIRMLNEAQDMVKLRDKLLTEANRLYFERRRVQVEMLLTPKADMLGRVKDELKVMELTANLDALTGGRFSAALQGRR